MKTDQAGATCYDALLVGSGQAAGPLATALTAAGRKTALIERIHIGGTCINEGCTPTKAMIASAETAHVVSEAEAFGVRASLESTDLAAVRRRKQGIVDSFRAGSTEAIEAGGVEIIRGQARFMGPNVLVVSLEGGERRELTAELIVLDLGTRPSKPPIPGLESVPALDSTTIMELDEIPAHLVILGGGYVGVEFGQMFRRFGSCVTIIQSAPSLLTREDPDVAEAVAAILREDGIEVRLGCTASHVEPGNGRGIALDVHDGRETGRVEGTHLLVATGRSPNTEDVGLDLAGVETTDRGFITVDERLKTTARGVYAVGDVTGGPAFTHIAYDDFRVLRDNLLRGGRRSTKDRLVPYTVFIDPQLGRVGLSETEARERGIDIEVARLPMASVARAVEVGNTRGMIKVVVDAHTMQILGGAVLGIEGGELMAMIEIAMMGRLPCTVLRDAIFAHPTLAESLNNLFSSID